MEQKPLSYTEVFQKFCPQYLHYGMTWEQYWNGDPWMVVYYSQAHDLAIRQRNQELWMQGLYNHDAFAVVLANAFAQKGTTPKKYLEKPLDILLPKSEEEIEAEEERELRKMVKQLNSWQKAFDAQNREDKDDNAL